MKRTLNVRRYLHINSRWEHHVLASLLNPEAPVTVTSSMFSAVKAGKTVALAQHSAIAMVSFFPWK